MMKIIIFSTLIILLTFQCFAQQVNKVLISGLGGGHDSEVKSAFEIGYASYDGTNFSGSIDLYYDNSYGIVNSFNYAQANGYNVIVRSTTGLYSVISQAPNYPDIKVFMPAGSNSFVYVYSGNVEASPVVITGAGDTCNETGYNVEFFSIDPITVNPPLSSFSNGYIAGQICYLANHLNITVEQARILARSTGTNNGSCNQYNGYGKVDVGSAINALPVELSSFTSNVSDNKVLLKWKTATEINNYGFSIERSQKTGISSQNFKWKKIGFVQGAGNSNSPKEYSFTDKPDGGVQFSYRLKQLDNDGRFEYSKTLEVSLNIPTQFSLEQNYPNPFNPTTTIKYKINNKQLATLKIYNTLGDQIATLVNEVKEPGEYKVEWNASRFASGVYYCRMFVSDAGNGSMKNFVETKKLVLLK